MTVSSSIGPISGIDYGKLIAGLSAIDQAPIDQIQTRIKKLTTQNTAFIGFSAILTGLKVSATSFTTAAIFRSATASSSNTSVLNATASIGTPTGSYQLTVQRLAAASQLASQGYANTTSPLGVAGDLTFGFGKGNLDPALKLSELNGGKGAARGSIRITDRAGTAAVIDLSKAVDVNDVVNTINNATGVNVTAAIDGDKLVLTDRSGGTGNFIVTDVGSTTTATDLGLAQSVASATLTGTDANKLTLTTALNSLNDGNGVRNAGILDDFSIAGSVGTANVSLNGAKTLGDALAKINAQTAATGVTASISASGHGITLTDAGGATTPTVTALNGNAARDLGLTTGATAGTGTLSGDRINAGLNSSLLRDLRGGQGLGLGTIHIANRAGGGADVDLSSARTVADVLAAINTSGAGVTASLNSSGTALVVADNSGAASGTLAITDVSGTAAADLGLAKSVTASSITGSDTHLRYISNNTSLATLNGGSGFKAGKIQLTDSKGSTFVVDLSGAAIQTVGDVINQINLGSTGIKASINDNGNGIVLTDSSGGGLAATVTEVSGGTTAASLGLLGSFVGGKIDGSQQKTVSVLATDTLTDVVNKINKANLGVAAQIINDGSDTPYRLSLVSKTSGANSNLIFNGDAIGINTTSLVKGQDAVVLYGNGSSQLQATSSSNTINTLVPSLTITLSGVGTANITVARDDSKISDAVQSFVDQYNKVVKNITDLTAFDSSDPTNRGVLFGDSTVRSVQQALGDFVTRSYSGVGPLKNLAAVGITVAQDGTLTLNTDTLANALTNNADDVRTLFTTNTKDSLPFSTGKFHITDSAGKSADVEIPTTAKSLIDVISQINRAGTGITAGLSAGGKGIVLMDTAGGALTAKVEDLGGTAASSLGIAGAFTGNTRTGKELATTTATTATQGIGATLSDLLDRFVNGQTGSIFKVTDALGTQTKQLSDRASDLNELLAAKKNRLIRTFAMLEVTISGLQSQGTAISNMKTSTSSSSS